MTTQTEFENKLLLCLDIKVINFDAKTINQFLSYNPKLINLLNLTDDNLMEILKINNKIFPYIKKHTTEMIDYAIKYKLDLSNHIELLSPNNIIHLIDFYVKTTNSKFIMALINNTNLYDEYILKTNYDYIDYFIIDADRVKKMLKLYPDKTKTFISEIQNNCYKTKETLDEIMNNKYVVLQLLENIKYSMFMNESDARYYIKLLKKVNDQTLLINFFNDSLLKSISIGVNFPIFDFLIELKSFAVYILNNLSPHIKIIPSEKDIKSKKIFKMFSNKHFNFDENYRKTIVDIFRNIENKNDIINFYNNIILNDEDKMIANYIVSILN